MTTTFEVRRTTVATPAEVFAVIAEGWLFASWVVGASRMRAVDDAWPAAGAQLQQSFGVWPAVIADTAEVLVNEAPNHVVVQAKSWPVGEATVDIRIDEWGEGSMITITEDATRGPGSLVPWFALQPVMALRNRETLRRLALLAEGRAGKTESATRNGQTRDVISR